MFTGPWVKVPRPKQFMEWNQIHDDNAARTVGFAGGFVGGPTLQGVASPAIFASFGHVWYESGAFSFRFANPVYDDEEIRVVWDEVAPDAGDKRKISFYLEKRSGERTTFGWASLGEPGQQLTPPWERTPPRAGESADDLLPDMKIGARTPSGQCQMPLSEVIPLLDSVQDYNWWFRVASPWGGPVVPPCRFIYLQRQRERTPENLPPPNMRFPIFAAQDAVVYAPIFVDQTYEVSSWLCEKGRSPRSAHFTHEHTLTDQSGKTVAIIRTKTRHLLSVLTGEKRLA